MHHSRAFDTINHGLLLARHIVSQNKCFYDFRTVNNLFYENFMILNPGKCYFMSIGKDTHDEMLFIMITVPSKLTMKGKY